MNTSRRVQSERALGVDRQSALLSGCGQSLGALLCVLGGLMGLAALSAIGLSDGAAAGAFVFGGAVTVFVGGALVAGLGGMEARVSSRSVLALALLTWIILPAFASLPVLLRADGVGTSFSEAYLASVSALTTTGYLPSMRGSTTPPALLAWYAMLGGVGGLLTLVFAVLMLATEALRGIPPSYRSYRRLETAARADRLSTAVWSVTRDIGPLYLAILALAFMSVFVMERSAFVALLVSAGFLSTSGLPPDFAELILSPALQPLCFGLMIVGAMSFLVLADASRTSLASLGRHRESQAFFALLGFLTIGAVVSGLAVGEGGSELWRRLFNAVSALTTTGTVIGDGAAAPAQVPAFGFAVLLLLALSGGCFASTAGGIKTVRGLLLLAHSRLELRRLAHPSGVMRQKLAGRTIRQEDLSGAWAVLLCLIFGIVLLGLVTAAHGSDFQLALTVGVAALANAGPLIELSGAEAVEGLPTGTGFQALFCAGMIAGRVEGLAILSLLTRAFWRG
ncbi:MAG: potassium transporter TrkG [Pseudomonadota bacterium]